MRKSLLGITFLAALGFATAANASLISVSFVDFGAGIQPPIVPSGDAAVDLTTATGTFNLATGSVAGSWEAPGYSAVSRDPQIYRGNGRAVG
jgi:hypothetical protein